MTNKKIWLGMLALALIFGMTVVGCGGGSGDNFGSDPVEVNLSLPAIQSVASFEGTFASNEADQKELVVAAIEGIQDISGDLSSGYSKTLLPNRSRAVQRAVETWGPEEFVFRNETIADGVMANGFVRASGKISYKDPYDINVGDYEEESIKAKLSLDFNNATGYYYNKINGKYAIDETVYYKFQITSLSPEKVKITLNANATNGYALSISKSGKGIKFVMKETIKFNVNMEFGEYDDFNPAQSGTYMFTLEVYDNDNTKQLSKTFNSPEAASEYLGVELANYF
jgi:hypothetical protein